MQSGPTIVVCCMQLASGMGLDRTRQREKRCCNGVWGSLEKKIPSSRLLLFTSFLPVPRPSRWPSGKASVWRAGDPEVEPRFSWCTSDVELLLYWLPSQAPGIIGSVSMKTECGYLYGWIEKRLHMQKSHPKC